jgi:O-antigen ligase
MEPSTTPEMTDAPVERRSLARTLSALFVGVVVAVDPSGLVPSGPARGTVTLAIIGVAVCLLVWRPVRCDRLSGLIWLGLIGWMLLAAVFGADALHAWIGTPDRRMGWLAWCTFPLLYLCGQAIVTRRDQRTVVRGAAIAASLLGVWCAFERAGWSLIDETFAGHRVGGPFGQPAYVGAAAVLLGPLAVGLVLDRDEVVLWKVAGALGAVGAGAALLLAQTRGAWLGALVVLVLLGVFHGGVVRRHWRLLVVAAVALVVLFAVTPLGGRVADAFDLGQGTTRGRFDDWAVGARVVEGHPVLGVGPEGYRVVFPQVVSARYVERYGSSVVPDRAHNGIIDVATSGGVVAGVLYAALLALMVVAGVRALRGRDPLTVALACGVIAYVVQQQFLFPLSEIDPLFWVVAGMLVAASPAARVVEGRVSRLVPVIVAAWVVFGVWMGAREVQADRLLSRAADAAGARGLRDADHATRLRSDSIRTWYVAARIAARGEAITDVDAAVVRVERGVRESPRDPALRVLHVDLLVERALRSGLADDRERARAVVTRYLVDAPNEREMWVGLAAIAHLDGDRKAEAAAAARAAQLRHSDSFKDSLQRGGDGRGAGRDAGPVVAGSWGGREKS